MGNRQAAIGAFTTLVLAVVPGAPSAACGSRPGVHSPHATGLRTDRLSATRLRTWKRIVDIARAQDHHGRSLHPALRGLFDAVDGGPHTVFVEILDVKSYLAGRFEVTRVDPEGRAHEGILILNLRAIDSASTEIARADGFSPFRGLSRIERYAEVLGHELAHAVWHLASTERAALAHGLQAGLEERVRALREERVEESGAAPRAPQTDLLRLAEELEGPAVAAERAVWEELQAAKQSRGARSGERGGP
jgi:hypothetical protein